MAESQEQPSPYAVRATAGSLRVGDGAPVSQEWTPVALSHAWTPEGVLAGPVTNGAQVLHLSVALCVLNDVYREARELGVVVDGVEVIADGGFDDEWRSTGIDYRVVVASPAPQDDVDRLLERVDEVAEIPRAVRAGADVRRTP